MLIIGRAVAGMGGSGLSNGALTILAAAAPIHKRPGELRIIQRLPNTNIDVQLCWESCSPVG
jgi:hypothetical protein